MARDDIFPFDLDGVRVLSESEIEHAGRVWRAVQDAPLSQWSLRPGWLRSGGQIEASPTGEAWQCDDAVLEPSVGPAWEGMAYIPTPRYVQEQVFRRRAGLPPKERRWLPTDYRPPRRDG